MVIDGDTRRVVLVLGLVVTASFVGGIGFGFVSAAAGDTETASVTASPRTAGAASVHTVTATGQFDGNLSKVLVGYGAAGDVDGASVQLLGVDRGSDGDVDETYPAAIGVRASRVHVVPRENVSLSAGDRVVVRLADVANPRTAGRYDARVTVRTTARTHTVATGYRVTPFAAPNSVVRNVTAPRSTTDGVVARDSDLRDTRVSRSAWRDVRLEETTVERVRSAGDRWRAVRVTDSSLRAVDSSRSDYRAVALTGASLVDVRFDDPDARRVAFLGTTVSGVTVADSTLERVAVTPDAPRGEADPVLAVDDRLSTRAVLETAEGRYDATRTDAAPGDNRLTDVTVRDSTLRDVRLVNATVEIVTFRGVTLRNVTLRNVTLRDVTVTDRTFADGTVTDETVTSERRLAYEFRTDDGVDAPVTGDVAVENGTVTASTDGAVTSSHRANESGAAGDASTSVLG